MMINEDNRKIIIQNIEDYIKKEVDIYLFEEKMNRFIENIDTFIKSILERNANLEKELRSKTVNNLKNELKKEVINELKAELIDEVRNELKHELNIDVRNELKHELSEDVKKSLKIELKDIVENELREELKPNFEYDLKNDLDSAKSHNDDKHRGKNKNVELSNKKNINSKTNPDILKTDILKNIITHKLTNNI
jgi:hypothetical protein